MPVKFHARTHTHNYSFTPSIVAHAFGGLGLIMSVKHCSTHMHSLVTSGLTIVQQPTLRRDFPWFISHVQNHVLARRAVVPAVAAAQVATSPLPNGFLWGRAHRLCYDGLLGCDSVQACCNISKNSSASLVWIQIGKVRYHTFQTQRDINFSELNLYSTFWNTGEKEPCDSDFSWSRGISSFYSATLSATW